MAGNVETVKKMYECFGRGDIAGIMGCLAPDVEWEHDWYGETLKWYTPRKGHEEVPGFFVSLADFEFVRFEPGAFLECVCEEGAGMVAVPVQLELVHKPTGNRIRDLEMHLWTFQEDGLVKRFRHFVDTRQFAIATQS